MDNSISDQLSQSMIFEGLSGGDIKKIMPCLLKAVREYSNGECICHKNGEAMDMGVVLDGTLLVCDESEDGTRTVLANIKKNELFGEIAIFSSAKENEYKIIAKGGTKVIFLSGDFFLKACNENCKIKDIHNEITKNMLRLLSDKTRMLNKKVTYLSAPSLKTKIAMYLYELYEANCDTQFVMPLNRDQLADFFSVARPSLSRELINLKDQGIIDFSRSKIKILKLNELIKIAKNY